MDSQEISPEMVGNQAKGAYQREEYLKAAEQFEKAGQRYLDGGDQLMAAEMFNNQAVALIQAEKPKQALQAVEGTPAVFEEAGDSKRQALALGNYASALEEMGQKEAALEHYTEAARILQQIDAQEEYTHVMNSISGLKLKMRSPFAALTSMQHSLEGVKNPTLFQRIKKWLLDVFFNLITRP